MNKPSMFSFNSFRVRLLLNFLAMLGIIVAVTLYTVQSATYSHSTEQLLAHAKTSASVVKDKITNRGNALKKALDTYSKDFDFKQLIATAAEDTASLEVALENFQRRSEAELAWVLNRQGTTIAASSGFDKSMLDLNAREIDDSQVTWHLVGNEYYMVKAAPIKFVETSRNINGWLLMGYSSTELINSELVELTDMDITLLRIGAENQILGTTFESAISDKLQKQQIIVDAGLHNLQQDLNNYLYTTAAFGVLNNLPLHLLLTSVEDKAYLDYNSLLGQLIIILLVAAVMSLLTAMLLSNGITRPLTNLVKVTNQIRQGEYVTEFPDSVTNEVSTLSSAISEMQEGIKQREEEIQYLAYFDSLTELPNRNQFVNYLKESIELCDKKHVAVMMMDLDRFKDINDTVGHEIGDVLLKDIANRLQSFAYEGVFIAHNGGDEFGIVIRDVEGQNPESLADNFATLFERPFCIDQLTLDIDVSIGVAMYPEDSDNAQGLMQCADIALYHCKDQHHPFAIYKPELNKHSVQRLNLMSELRGALAEGQLQLYYQPKLAISENRISTVECLIRWIHPVHGFIPPDDFIPLAEQTGAIRDVTHWGLKTAFEQQQKWRENGHKIGIAVNISAIDLVDMKLPAYVAELMSDYNADQDALTLEVTESAVMADPESALKALNTLRRMGITLSIDDFGTGYSSMAQLKKMPVDELKIDKAFVLELAKNEDDQIMVKTLVSLAQNLGLKTVAEGVEDGEALNFLAKIGCTKAQGYYLSKPLPAEDFDQWLDAFIDKQKSA